MSKSAKLTEKINKYHSAHDSLYFYTKSDAYDFEPATKKRDEPKWRGMHLPGIRWSLIPDEFVKLFSKENLKEKNLLHLNQFMKIEKLYIEVSL